MTSQRRISWGGGWMALAVAFLALAGLPSAAAAQAGGPFATAAQGPFAAAAQAGGPFAAAQADGGAQASIIGGRAASIAEFPSVAYIEAHVGQIGFACTGTVVSPRVVLTAAHCVEDLERGGFTPSGDYRVATGIANPSQSTAANVFRVSETHVFPGFDPGILRGDAGILVLSTPTAAPPLPLAGAGDAALYEGGATVQLAGWGLTRENAASPPASLRSTTMLVQDPAFCRRKTHGFYAPYSPAAQLCTLDQPAKKSGGCFGDSGGPAIGQRADGTPVELGIVSTGGPFCSTKLPNIFTRVDFVSTWVAEWIAATEAGAPRPVVDPHAPFPLLTKPVAEGFTLLTLQDRLGRRFEGAKQVFGGCRRASRVRFRCEASWIAGRFAYGAKVSPFYVRRQDAVTWDSHFLIRWGALRCLRDSSRARHCQIHTLRG
ncbi:MAG TPA: serine protease [Solirubrobacterales bacterium]|nr:serine protease [Solirubrobacterales bacterium]